MLLFFSCEVWIAVPQSVSTKEHFWGSAFHQIFGCYLLDFTCCQILWQFLCQHCRWYGLRWMTRAHLQVEFSPVIHWASLSGQSLWVWNSDSCICRRTELKINILSKLFTSMAAVCSEGLMSTQELNSCQKE